MTSRERWEKAQAYERSHWQAVATSIAGQREDLQWYEWRANHIRARLQSVAPELIFEELRVLEVGSGPVGTISFFPAARRSAVDPLTDYYSTQPELIRNRNPAVQYLASNGEALPFQAGEFSLVIMENVIDHTHSPEAVLAEIHRVLGSGGFMYMTVNVHTTWGLWTRRFMELFELDRGHPHNYTQALARKLVVGAGFDVLAEDVEPTKVAKQKELQDRRFRTRLKLLLGVYDIVFEVLAKRRKCP